MDEADAAALLLEKLTPEVRTLIQHPRALVLDALPGVTEKVHMGWGVIHCRAGSTMRDVVDALAPRRGYVKLEFSDGVELPDPSHRLEGTGKRLRHVKIRGSDDAQHADVRTLLQAAARHRGLALSLFSRRAAEHTTRTAI